MTKNMLVSYKKLQGKTMKIKKLLKFCGMILLLNGCSVADQAMFNPEGNYVNGIVSSKTLEADKTVTVVGSQVDENGNYFPAYLSLLKASTYHKKVRFSPASETIFVKCFAEHFTSSVAGPVRTSYKHTTSGEGIAQADGGFVLGKTYQVFCNKLSEKTYKITTKEVNSKTKFDNTDIPKTEQPNDSNRVTFIITGKSLDSYFSRLVSTTAMAIRNWDGKLTDKAELAAPVSRIYVSCRVNRVAVDVSIQRSFEAGKTYRVACKNDQGIMQAYIAEEIYSEE